MLFVCTLRIILSYGWRYIVAPRLLPAAYGEEEEGMDQDDFLHRQETEEDNCAANNSASAGGPGNQPGGAEPASAATKARAGSQQSVKVAGKSFGGGSRQHDTYRVAAGSCCSHGAREHAGGDLGDIRAMKIMDVLSGRAAGARTRYNSVPLWRLDQRAKAARPRNVLVSSVAEVSAARTDGNESSECADTRQMLHGHSEIRSASFHNSCINIESGSTRRGTAETEPLDALDAQIMRRDGSRHTESGPTCVGGDEQVEYTSVFAHGCDVDVELSDHVAAQRCLHIRQHHDVLHDHERDLVHVHHHSHHHSHGHGHDSSSLRSIVPRSRAVGMRNLNVECTGNQDHLDVCTSTLVYGCDFGTKKNIDESTHGFSGQNKAGGLDDGKAMASEKGERVVSEEEAAGSGPRPFGTPFPVWEIRCELAVCACVYAVDIWCVNM
jgi:hypothetical protein